MTLVIRATHKAWRRPSDRHTTFRAWSLVLAVSCCLALGPAYSLAQTSTKSVEPPAAGATPPGARGPNVLQEISDAVARIAERTTPAVVGIWVDIKPGAKQASSRNKRSEPRSEDEGQSTEAIGRMLSKRVASDLERRMEAAIRKQKEPPSQEAPSDQFPQMQRHQLALGSGFIASPDGYILTNNHVVGNADLVLVIVGDEEPVKAEVVGTDLDTDLAVIKVKGQENLPVLKLADSEKLKVGDWVVAIGQPFGLSHTVTSGIISALGRSNMDLSTYEDFIQTDAPINPGNSGGPLVNLNGEVIGVNTAIVGSEGSIGIGFAIPANMVRTVYEQIRKNGKVLRGYLGINMQDLTPDLAAIFGTPRDTKGILVSHVAEDSPAAAAGLKPGDVLVQFDGRPIPGATAFATQVSLLQPGSKVPLVLLRHGTRQDLTLEMGTRPAKSSSAKERPTLEVLGMALQDLTDDLAQRLNYQGVTGVLVVAVADNSPAEALELGAGMLIQEVNRRPVRTLSEFKTALEEAAEKPPILFLVNNQGAYRYVATAPDNL
jgi:serine protease Do